MTEVPPLKLNDAVRYRHGSIWKLARVISDHTAPRSCVIQAAEGMILRQNRHHLKKKNEAVVVNSSYDA